jgi:hypothetical protein
VTVGLASLTLGFPLPAVSAEQDLNLWSVFFLGHHFDEHWAAAFQVEVRAQDDITDLDAVILKPGGYYHFNEHVALGVGYKFQAKQGVPNENDGWQGLYLDHVLGSLSLGHQFRMEERFIRDVDGAIARLRYLLHFQHPINRSWYLAGSEAARFNLNDQGEGPVQGFEQNRIYFGVGYRTGIARIEFGYLWRYELSRSGPDTSDHVLRFQFLFDTKGRHPSRAGS